MRRASCIPSSRNGLAYRALIPPPSPAPPAHGKPLPPGRRATFALVGRTAMSPPAGGGGIFYRAGRVKEGPFQVLAVLPQRRDKVRYRIRRQDDGTVEYVADESELSTT